MSLRQPLDLTADENKLIKDVLIFFVPKLSMYSMFEIEKVENSFGSAALW